MSETGGPAPAECAPCRPREYEDFLKNAQLSVMSDPELLRLMRATHIKELA